MTRNATRSISALFLLVALYDGVVGAAFLAIPSAVFHHSKVPPPNHYGYVQFPAALLIVFALMFVSVARDPIAHRDLIIYGILLKVSFCAIAFWYWFTSGIPGLWKPFAIIDLVTAGLFVWSYLALGTRSDMDVPVPASDR